MWEPGYPFEHLPKAHAISSLNEENTQYGIGFITSPRQTLCDLHDKLIYSAAVHYTRLYPMQGMDYRRQRQDMMTIDHFHPCLCPTR